MKPCEIETQTRSIEGSLSCAEGRRLFRLARKCRRGVIVEIGGWKGKATIWMAHGARKGKKGPVHSIDPGRGRFDAAGGWNFRDLHAHLAQARVERMVTAHLMFSEDCARTFAEPVELVFIGAFEGQRRELELWSRKLVEGGVMAFQFKTWDAEARRFAKDYFFKSRHFRNVGFCNSITYGQRVDRNSGVDRFKNRLMLWLFEAHAWRTQHGARMVQTWMQRARKLIGKATLQEGGLSGMRQDGNCGHRRRGDPTTMLVLAK